MKGLYSLRDSFRTGLHCPGNSDEDMICSIILDCIGTLTRIHKGPDRRARYENKYSLLASKRRVFWQALREVADQNLVESQEEDFCEINSALSTMLDSFPHDNKKLLNDGCSWLPLHWAVSLPNVNILDIKTLITAQPEAVSTLTTRSFGYNPVHLACMANARVEVLHLLQAHFPLWGESVASCYGFTPLHLAVKYSSSPALVRELVRLYPPALEMEDEDGDIPLHLISSKSSEGLQILQALLDAAPHTAQYPADGLQELPLHRLLESCGGDSSPMVMEMVSTLLAAYPDAVNIRDTLRTLPIHYAAAHAPVQVFQMIAEENMANLTAVDSRGWSVASMAVMYMRLETLRYIQSIRPEVLLLGLPPPIVHLVNTHCLKSYAELCSPMSACSEILRLLLHHYGTVIAKTTEHHGGGGGEEEDGDPLGYRALYKKLTDAEEKKRLDLSYPRRLLLLAGHPSLCLPEVLRDLNYSARRGALLLFYHHHPTPAAAAGTTAAAARDTRDAADIFWWIRDGPGSKELIRAIIGFQ